MNRWISTLFIALAAWAMASCSDDESDSNSRPDVGADRYEGEYKLLTLGEPMKGFRYADFVCELSAENGDLVRREGSHLRIGGLSELHLDVGLCPGTYRLLRLLAAEIDPATADTTWVEYGLGCRIQLGANADAPMVLDAYNQEMSLFGSGTKEDPYIISCSDNLKALRNFTNDDETNVQLTEGTYFRQTVDIDMKAASIRADREKGWIPIGNLSNCPFRGIYDGNGKTISNLWIDRPTFSKNACVGLFGFAESAVFRNVNIQSASVVGNMGVGTLLGCAVTVGNRRTRVALVNCTVKNSYVATSADGLAVGGLVGMVDYSTDIMMNDCTNDGTTVNGDYCVGGLLGGGGKASRSVLKGCTNNAPITAQYTGAGGIAGSVDSLLVMGCSNQGKVRGAAHYGEIRHPGDPGCLGTGGIAGGSGSAIVVACSNEAWVEGHTGVGGIIGSTRICQDAKNGLIFNDVSAQCCYNTGYVRGLTAVGGIVGEAQFGCHSVYNTGVVSAYYAEGHLGGIAGNTSIAVLYNAMNKGNVGGNVGTAGGIVGKTNWGNFYACQNLEEVDINGHTVGGIVGKAGNYTVVDYCCNLGKVSCSDCTTAGGVIGEIGAPRKWSDDDIALCVIGAAEMVMGFVSPLISYSGSALAAGSALSKFVHVMHIGETLLDAGTLAYDLFYGLGWGTYKMLTEEELRIDEASLEMVENKSIEVKETMKRMRDEVKFANVLTAPLDAGALDGYWSNFKKVCDSFDQDDNARNVNYNMNEAREKRLGKLEHSKRVEEIAHKVIAGVCVLVTGAAIIVSMVPTGGTTAPLLALLGGSVSSIIGGANAITEGCQNYTQNVVVVSQCANIGTLHYNKITHGGGVIGYAHQNCYVSDCLSAGKGDLYDSKAGAVLGYASAGCEIARCMSVGNGWNDPVALSANLAADFIGNHFYFGWYEDQREELGRTYSEFAAKGFEYGQLCAAGNYSGWDMNNDGSLWTVTATPGYFPVPKNSAMQKTINK